MSDTLVSLSSIAVAVLALMLAFWQTQIAARSLQTQAQSSKESAQLQALISFRELARECKYADSIEIISRLKCKSYLDFVEKTERAERDQIRDCIEFLNFVCILINSGHIERQSVWNVYFVAFRIVGKNLSPWWFEGEWIEHPQRYSSAKRMAEIVLEVSEEQIAAFDDRKRLTGEL
ncbi:DUF4760 domain-containing protein [Alteraurantiacibacter buctensis]|uniref:DUF4760 domain-containing protein n=1 Tax=Alteraurantiacibacter buctensis TaxID=1503981 RepID=A0A844YYX0_9SPHN|nr:hypothetical protein [Alteraurantiacibacter buctensis]MXO73525.1 hypothetical protein [Alteraurantiacibacter buctensis]